MAKRKGLKSYESSGNEIRLRNVDADFMREFQSYCKKEGRKMSDAGKWIIKNFLNTVKNQ